MFKRSTLILILSALVLISCTRWDYSDPNMPEELKANHEKIISEQMEILKDTPEDVDALFEVAYRYQMLGNYKEAVSYYEKVLEQNENHFVTLNNLANIYEDMQDYDKSAEYIKRAYVLDETNIETIKDVVRILLEAGDPENAQKALENFAKKIGDTDPDMSKMISDLYEEIMASKEENK